MRLRLSRLALEDIDRIDAYTVAHWGTEQADKYVHALWDALEEIQKTPERWRLRPDIRSDCRARVCGRHLIIYRVRDGKVEVSRILHGSMNLGDHIPPNFMGDE